MTNTLVKPITFPMLIHPDLWWKDKVHPFCLLGPLSSSPALLAQIINKWKLGGAAFAITPLGLVSLSIPTLIWARVTFVAQTPAVGTIAGSFQLIWAASVAVVTCFAFKAPWLWHRCQPGLNGLRCN